jgi:hypothetical protein
VLIVLGIVLPLVAAARNDKYSWQGYLIGSISFAFGILWLVLSKWPED